MFNEASTPQAQANSFPRPTLRSPAPGWLRSDTTRPEGAARRVRRGSPPDRAAQPTRPSWAPQHTSGARPRPPAAANSSPPPPLAMGEAPAATGIPPGLRPHPTTGTEAHSFQPELHPRPPPGPGPPGEEIPPRHSASPRTESSPPNTPAPGKYNVPAPPGPRDQPPARSTPAGGTTIAHPGVNPVAATRVPPQDRHAPPRTSHRHQGKDEPRYQSPSLAALDPRIAPPSQPEPPKPSPHHQRALPRRNQRHPEKERQHMASQSTTSDFSHGRDEDVFSALGGGFELRQGDQSEHLESWYNNLESSHHEASRNLLVRNLAPDVSEDELGNIFKSFGELRTLYTAKLHMGLIVVSYYDIRAATGAKKTLQGTLVSNCPIDVQFIAPHSGTQELDVNQDGANQGTVHVFNTDSDTSNQHLAWLYSKFGEVQLVSDNPLRPNKKFVTFYDSRHAAVALQAMNPTEHVGKLAGTISPQHTMTQQTSHYGSVDSLINLAQGQGQVGDSQGQGQVGDSQARNRVGARPGIMPTNNSNNNWDSINPMSSSLSVDNLLSRLSHHTQQQPQQHQLSASHGGMGGHGLSGSPLLGTSPPERSFAANRSNLRFGSQGDLSTAHLGCAPNYGMDPMTAATSSRSMHLSDSASSISATAANNNTQFFGGGPVPGPGGNKQGMHLGQASGLHGPASHPGGGNSSNGTLSNVDLQAQQLLIQSGMSPAEATEMLMSLKASQPHMAGVHRSHQSLWPGGHGHLNPIVEGSEGPSTSSAELSNLYNMHASMPNMHASMPNLHSSMPNLYGMDGGASGGAGSTSGSGNNGTATTDVEAAMASHLAGLMLQQRQQQSAFSQQHQQLAFASQLAALQAHAQQASLAGGGAHHMAQAHQLLQAAQLNQAMAHVQAHGSNFLNQPHANNLASSLAAAQLLQQAGMGFAMSPKPHMSNQMAGALPRRGSQGGGMSMGGNPMCGQPGLGGMHRSGSGSGAGGPAGLGGPGGPTHGQCGESSSSAASWVAAGTDASRSRGRLSRRTTDPAAEAERKAQQEKLYALDHDRIRAGEDKRTTLMVKNIPNKYTQKMLLATIDEYVRGSYDFFYLPIDFKNKCNVGYAFINMIQPVQIIPLVERFNNRKWDRFNSEKVCHISYARIQGRASLVAHFQNSSLMHEDKRCRPILFTLDGGEAGEQEPFPLGGGLGSAGGSSNSLAGGHGSSSNLKGHGSMLSMKGHGHSASTGSLTGKVSAGRADVAKEAKEAVKDAKGVAKEAKECAKTEKEQQKKEQQEEEDV
eukprot:gene21450-28420_t